MSVFCGRVERVVVNEVADVAAKSAETSVTPETAGMARALTRVQVATMSRGGTSLLGEGVGHDIAPSCLTLRKGEPSGDSDTHTFGRFTQAMNGRKVREYIKGTCVPENSISD